MQFNYFKGLRFVKNKLNAHTTYHTIEATVGAGNGHTIPLRPQ